MTVSCAPSAARSLFNVTARQGVDLTKVKQSLEARVAADTGINALLLPYAWHKGALRGLTPAEAFYVKCDEETNPAEGIDAGRVVCEIGVAPVKPAEFVVFRLAQFSSGASLVFE